MQCVSEQEEVGVVGGLGLNTSLTLKCHLPAGSGACLCHLQTIALVWAALGLKLPASPSVGNGSKSVCWSGSYCSQY